MPKINGKSIDPKVYAARVTNAKKVIAKTDPELKRKIAQMYPKVSNKDVVKKALSPKPTTRKMTSVPSAKKTPIGTAKPMTPAQRQGMAKRPMIGADKSARKKYGSKSNNNGYTN